MYQSAVQHLMTLPGPTRAIAIIATLLLATFAGCIEDADTNDSQGDDDCGPSALDEPGLRTTEPTYDPIANLTREDMWLHEHRNLRTCTLPAVGWHPLRESGPHNYIGEIDFRGDLDLGAVAVLGNQETPMVYLLDITDRAAPVVLSTVQEDDAYIVDVKISRDGDLLFTATQVVPRFPQLSTDPDDVPDPADLPDLSRPSGFSVYDISDPNEPVLLHEQRDVQYGCHMLSHMIIDGDDWLFCVSQQVRAYHLLRTAAGVNVVGFSEYLPTQDGVPTPSDPPVVGRILPDEMQPIREAVYAELSDGPHDMTLQEDPRTGNTYAIVSHWNSGLRVVDVTMLPQMEEVGIWEGEGATHYDGNVHSAMMFYVGDDRYIAATPEMTYGGVVPSVWVLDANDLSELKLVGEWYHPNEHDAQGLFLTLHQWQVAPTGTDVTDPHDVRIYITYNHAGVWVLDLGAILEGDRWGAILGYNLARKDILDPDEHPGNAPLNTWDVNVVDGHIYGSDRATGLWVFHYTDDELGDTNVTGFA